MLNAIARRYGMLAARKQRPYGLELLRGRVHGWRQARRRGQSMRIAHEAISSTPDHNRFREMAFTFALIALAAKVVTAEGAASGTRWAQFNELFPLPEMEAENKRQLFSMASGDSVEPVVHARQIAGLFPASEHRAVLLDVLQRLARLASPEGMLGEANAALLRQVGDAFGLKPRVLSRMLKGADTELPRDPYALLQAKKKWNDRQIRQAYLKLTREYHPDQVQARGGSAIALRRAGEHMALVNASYAQICEERGVKG